MPTLADASVPIIGQQVAIDGYTIAIAMRCQCASGGSFVPLTLSVGGAGTATTQNACQRCGTGYVIEGMSFDAQQRLTFAVGILSKRPEES